MSLPARGVWIEMLKYLATLASAASSLPARGVWIEIFGVVGGDVLDPVTPREGSVD